MGQDMLGTTLEKRRLRWLRRTLQKENS